MPMDLSAAASMREREEGQGPYMGALRPVMKMRNPGTYRSLPILLPQVSVNHIEPSLPPSTCAG